MKIVTRSKLRTLLAYMLFHDCITFIMVITSLDLNHKSNFHDLLIFYIDFHLLNSTPTWVHFDKRYGNPACSAGYPDLRLGGRGIYVLVLQDALNALGFSTYSLDGIFGNNTRNAVIAYQRDNGLSADGIVGCGTWTRLVSEVVGIGLTPTVIEP